MRSKELHPAAASGIEMTEHDEEAGMLQVHVGIYVHKWIPTKFYTAFGSLLYRKLAE